jgi:hypothetical protein
LLERTGVEALNPGDYDGLFSIGVRHTVRRVNVS